MTSQSSATNQQLNLLLLPSPPSEISFTSFKTAYGPPLEEVLSQVSTSARSEVPSILDIAILCEQSTLDTKNARSSAYPYAHQVLSCFYKLACYICAAQGNTQQSIEDVDFRLVLIREDTTSVGHGAQELLSQGPIVDLQVLAHSIRPWANIYASDGERGEAFLRRFLEYRRSLPLHRRVMSWETHRINGGTSIRIPRQEAKAERMTGSGKAHHSVAVGGTFDHLHVGHKLLLTATSLLLQPVPKSAKIQGRCLTVGITGDELLKNKKYAELLESWDERQQAVIRFLSGVMNFDSSCDDLEVERVFNKGPNGKAVNYKMDGNLTIRCVEISDPFGPTITDEAISALVVSAETRSGGKAVNDKRAEKKWSLLEVFEVDVLDAGTDEEAEATKTEGFQSKISSTEIRKRLHERQARGLHL